MRARRWTAGLCLVMLWAGPAFAEAGSTVAMEDLTWTELRDLIRAGNTTVILPTGGVEQNGPHMALGKHNARVKILSERIARALGNALVAPVLAYVPEGRLDPPTGHMRFPGTMTVPDSIFEKILESSARSLRLHGFRDIVFLGDHGSSQSGQKAVATRLDREWDGSAVRVHAVEDYYRTAEVDFAALLRTRGYREDPAGSHAGLADTSLTLALEPSMVRMGRGRPGTGLTDGDGVVGDPSRASAELGQLGVDLIVSRTVEAIKSSIARRSRASTLAPALVAATATAQQSARPAIETVAGMPPVVDPNNLYSEARADNVSPAVANALPRVYVPNLKSNDVYVIDPTTFKVVARFPVGRNPQHVVPSYDLRTLWVTNNAEGRTDGSLTPIDPTTGKPGKAIAVDDPYNMYFTPDGRSAIVVAEALKRLDFRDPHTMALQSSLEVPQCAGINHADFSIDGRFAMFTCEFAGSLARIDFVDRKVLGYLTLSRGGMPQDIRVSPDGAIFYVADMKAGGVFLVDGTRFKEIGFIKTGVGTHGLYPSRDGTKLYVANRGSSRISGPPHGKGSVSVIDFATRKIVTTWPIPGGGSPDMGNVSVDGTVLWLSGRYDNVMYAIDTTTGAVRAIPVGKEPHGATVWPQPGRYSLGHTGNMR